MDKPQPNTELYVHIKPGVSWIDLYAFTPDALEWVHTEAPDYGTLYPGHDHISLQVLPCYDMGEVAVYLNSFND